VQPANAHCTNRIRHRADVHILMIIQRRCRSERILCLQLVVDCSANFMVDISYAYLQA
jgi:hypothetical protein